MWRGAPALCAHQSRHAAGPGRGELRGAAWLALAFSTSDVGTLHVDKTSVEDFTEALLRWWRTNGKSFPVWALAARIGFAISPSSAACERVFALLKKMFTDDQRSTLGDALEAALMLRSNGRRVG